MTKNHRIRHGECLAELAFRNGFAHWKVIRDAPENAELFRKRRDANALHPGDLVFVPKIRKRQELGETAARHRFRRLLPKKPLRLRFGADSETPFAGKEYVLRVWGGRRAKNDAVVFEDTLDAKGGLDWDIPLDAEFGDFEVFIDGRNERPLRIGMMIDHMSPLNLIEGVQGRLSNLGYDIGVISGRMNANTKAAIRAFQASQGLAETGELDELTLAKLRQVHGS